MGMNFFLAKCQLVTIFSATNYFGEFDNAGAMDDKLTTVLNEPQCILNVKYIMVNT
jgi:hypothetical protein